MAYIHGEAYCLMEYTCAKCGHRETIWNSRDGVTPFVVDCVKCGGNARHRNWRQERAIPDYKPAPNTRYFRDMTAADAKQTAERMFERSQNTEYAVSAEEKEEWMAMVIAEMIDHPGAPWLATVSAEEATP